MVFLKRSIPVNSKKRPAISSDNIHDSAISASTSSAVESSISSVVNTVRSSKGRAILETEGDDDDQDVNLMISILAEGGCTLRVSRDAPPSLPDDPHNLRRHIEFRLSSSEPPSILSRFVSGFTAYIRSPQNLRRVLIPAKHNGDGLSCGESLLRVLLVVAPLQQHILNLLLEKLPEHFNADAASASCSLKDDIARLIVHQLRWLDFVVDSEPFAEKLMEVLSISPPRLKKEIIGSLPEIIGEKCHATVVAALEKMLIEDSDVIVPVLDSFINLNLDEHLQEQAVTIALSCIRTVDGEHMPHLLRFLLFSTTPANATRIILQIRDQLKLTVSNPFSARNKKLKGKSPAENTEASILDALRTSLRFKNVLCEAVLKELKSLNQPSQHKAIDLWFLMLIYNNGGSLQKDAQKVLKKKIVDGCFGEALFDQCIGGNQELIKVYFPSFISLSEYLLSCKEQQARRLSIHLYVSLFDEFKDTYSRQEVLGALVTHIGSGIAHEVDSALEALILLTSRFSEELISLSSHITGILDYMESFHEENLHKVYEVFSRLSLSAKFKADTNKSSIGNELLIIIRKQISNADMMYRKMGVIGTFKVVSTLGDANAPSCFPSSQKSNADDALELLQMSLDSCKLAPSTLILLYDELIALLKNSILKPQIIEWIGKHASEFEPMFLSDLEGGQLPSSASCDGIEGELWINLDGDASPICLKILPLLSSPLHQQSESLQTLPSQFLLLSVVERYSNQGSLGGIDALLGCPLHLPSAKGREACCADPAAELPLHLHLLRDLHRKLKGFSSPSKQSPAACSAEVSPGVNQVKSCEFLSKIKPTFGSLRRHLDTAVFLLRDGSGGCNNHWKSELCSAGIPDLSNLMTSTTSIASSVFREVLRCFNMILRLDELYYQENLQILKDLLEVFQSTETPCNYFLELQKLSMPGSMDYVYCGVYSFLECILETSLLLSFLMASEVVIALQSLVSSKVLLIKSQETKGKSIYSGCSQDILRSLINRLASSAHRLLVYDCSGNDNETEWKRNGEIMQKILQIYLTNAESTSDLLNELACSILPQIPSSKASNTQDATHGFPTLCPTMFHIWYKVLHEENINALSKLLKEVKLKHVTIAGSDSAGKMLAKIQQSVQVVVSLVNLCKSHDKVAVHAMAVKYGGKYVELFLKAFDFLQAQFQSHNELIIEMFKEFQKATRVIQTLCSEAKGSKRTMVTSKVPATKKSMEKFLFHVKALLHNNSSSGCTFWMGNLKHKDLHGQVVSSQLYENGGDDDEYNSNENEPYESVGDCERR